MARRDPNKQGGGPYTALTSGGRMGTPFSQDFPSILKCREDAEQRGAGELEVYDRNGYIVRHFKRDPGTAWVAQDITKHAHRRPRETVDLNTIAPADRAMICIAVAAHAKARRTEATECAKAVGKWENPDTKRLVKEAEHIDEIAALFAEL